MADVRFSQASNAYQDALRAAERIIAKAGSGDAADSTQSTSAMGSSFFDMVGSSLKGAETAGYKSEDVAMKSLTGKADLTDVITAVANAESSLNTVVAVRDRVINAYQDIIKMTM